MLKRNLKLLFATKSNLSLLLFKFTTNHKQTNELLSRFCFLILNHSFIKVIDARNNLRVNVRGHLCHFTSDDKKTHKSFKTRL